MLRSCATANLRGQHLILDFPLNWIILVIIKAICAAGSDHAVVSAIAPGQGYASSSDVIDVEEPLRWTYNLPDGQVLVISLCHGRLSVPRP